MGESGAKHVIEATSETFENEVIAKSHEVPVVVDFWAEWCGPCRMLGPVLERLAEEYAGKFLLVKANTEELPDVAAGFGVRSIPAVFCLRDGKVVDMFVGVLPETAIRTWIDRLLPTAAETKAASAAILIAANPKAAETAYREALALDPLLVTAKIGLARAAAAQGRPEEAQAVLAELEKRGYLEPEAERLKAELAIKNQAEELGNVEMLRAAVAAAPDDLEAKLKLAEGLAASGNYDEALRLSLDLVERDRKGVGEEARKTMLRIFQLLPEDSDLLAESRRKLSVALS